MKTHHFPGFRDYQHVAITVSHLERSLAFYRDLLGFTWLGRLTYRNKDMLIDFLDTGGGSLLEIFSFDRGTTRASDYRSDDTQVGLRHFAFRVRSVDETYARLKAAGVAFTRPPFDSFTGLRLAFFLDPDGSVIEILEGDLAPALGRPRPSGDALLYDHLAITVSNLDRALALYRDLLGFPVLNTLDRGDERGLHLTLLAAGTSMIELFSYTRVATVPRPWERDERAVGLKHVGLWVDDVFAGEAQLRQGGVPIIYSASHALGGVDTCFFADQDGHALELISGTVTYDA